MGKELMWSFVWKDISPLTVVILWRDYKVIMLETVNLQLVTCPVRRSDSRAGTKFEVRDSSGNDRVRVLSMDVATRERKEEESDIGEQGEIRVRHIAQDECEVIDLTNCDSNLSSTSGETHAELVSSLQTAVKGQLGMVSR
eukprot:IDg14032t1